MMNKPEPYKTLKVLNFRTTINYLTEKYGINSDNAWADITEWMNQGKNDSYGVCNLEDLDYAEESTVKYLKLLKEEYPEEKELCFFISW